MSPRGAALLAATLFTRCRQAPEAGREHKDETEPARARPPKQNSTANAGIVHPRCGEDGSRAGPSPELRAGLRWSPSDVSEGFYMSLLRQQRDAPKPHVLLQAFARSVGQ